MEEIIGVRCWFVSRSRYTYRGRVTFVRGSLACLTKCAKVIDLGDGTHAPKEEIKLPDGWFVDIGECEAFGPEPPSWGNP